MKRYRLYELASLGIMSTKRAADVIREGLKNNGGLSGLTREEVIETLRELPNAVNFAKYEVTANGRKEIIVAGSIDEAIRIAEINMKAKVDKIERYG